ncbi:NADP-dependent oxidoreductase [Actinomadura parmotrematis]|uniref:NADP-dependent oxidoreductase n=1 Tax=Actinomadura parmotrematis TaxID=2864039 RepID=A0ABS7FR61_9ACTN|nr:NADP-dependent oxidoreductase [Actinomadura parmotrematis]MBW8482893.1 NADP-dependent oxidoreductase [Actinomadura parmotrematis]
MRAIVVRSFGGPEVLEAAEVPDPEPGPGQVRIRVTAAAVNPVDALTRSGALPLGDRPAVGLGWDAAGVVDAVGPGAAGFAAGDEVIGLRDRLDVPAGAYAELLVLDAASAAPAPPGLDAAAAATLPLNALTAAQALDLLDLPPGASLLVTGAAGAVGGYAVELAARRGLRVVAAAGAADEEVVRRFGAEWFVPRGAHLGDAVRALVPGGADGALDAAMLGARTLDAVRSGGAFVPVNAGPSVPPPLRGIRVAPVWIRADGARLAELADLAARGRLTPRVAAVLPLADAAEAHARLAKGGLRGRLVLAP